MADTNAPPQFDIPTAAPGPAPLPEETSGFLSIASAVALAVVLTVVAVIAAVTLPVAGAAIAVMVAVVAVAYALKRCIEVVAASITRDHPVIAATFGPVWDDLPEPVKQLLRWSWWLILALILALALNRWHRGRGVRGPNKG